MSPKLSKKAKKHLRAMASGTFTPAQRLMRAEMIEVHSASELMNEVFGTSTDLTDTALDVINSGPNLALTLDQWVIVQGLIEDGIRAGFALGSGQAAPKRG